MASEPNHPASIDLKIVVLGPAGVGKTCIIHRFCNGKFIDQTLATIGAGFFPHKITLEGTEMNIMLWDTAGEERFRSVAPSLLRGTNGVVLVFDLSSDDSLSELQIYVDLFFNCFDSDTTRPPPILLLGNKKDLKPSITVDARKNFAKRFNIVHVCDVSAKTGEGIKEAFEEFLKDFLCEPPQAESPRLSIDPQQCNHSSKPEKCNC